MPSFTDQTGRTVSLESSPQRIISLVPSQTELLFDLGLDEEVVGVTKFCIHPAEWFYTKRRVGGTKKLYIDIIHQLQPDLIIANKEENVKEQVEELARDYPVWISDVTDMAAAYEMIGQIGLLTGKIEKAKEIISTIKENFVQLLHRGASGQIPNSSLQLRAERSRKQKPQTCYFIWNDPYMTVGGDTFIHSMMEAAGFENIFKNKQRYPIVTTKDLLIASTSSIAQCELILLSSEPFPFKQKHIDELQLALSKEGLFNIKIILVDGEMFSWYGSRLQYAAKYFEDLHRSKLNKQ